MKQEIERSIAAARIGRRRKWPPPTVSGAKFYVSISAVQNGTTRPTPEVEKVVHDAITAKLAQLGEYQLAPASESPSDAKAAVAARSLKGYYLAVSLAKFDYSGRQSTCQREDRGIFVSRGKTCAGRSRRRRRCRG